MLRPALAFMLLVASPALAAPDPAFKLAFPVDCRLGQTCEMFRYNDRDPAPGVARDYRGGTVTQDDHRGIDIRLMDMAAQKRGVAVLAAADGVVGGLREGVEDISVTTPGRREVIRGAECGNAVSINHPGGWRTQYCHMARGSLKVKVGDTVKAGQPIGMIGLSGDTEFPHLHLLVARGSEVVDPFDVDGASVWVQTPPYQTGAILNVGFLAQPATMALIEAGDTAAPTAEAPMLVVYGRSIDLRAGDVQALVLKGPDGKVLSQNRTAPLARGQQQSMMFIGNRRPASGWPKGLYQGEYQVWRDGKLLVSRSARLTL